MRNWIQDVIGNLERVPIVKMETLKKLTNTQFDYINDKPDRYFRSNQGYQSNVGSRFACQLVCGFACQSTSIALYSIKTRKPFGRYQLADVIDHYLPCFYIIMQNLCCTLV